MRTILQIRAGAYRETQQRGANIEKNISFFVKFAKSPPPPSTPLHKKELMDGVEGKNFVKLKCPVLYCWKYLFQSVSLTPNILISGNVSLLISFGTLVYIYTHVYWLFYCVFHPDYDNYDIITKRPSHTTTRSPHLPFF